MSKKKKEDNLVVLKNGYTIPYETITYNDHFAFLFIGKSVLAKINRNFIDKVTEGKEIEPD